MQIVQAFASLATSERVLEALRRRSHRAIGGLWGASAALLISFIHCNHQGSTLVLTADDDETASLDSDLRCFLGDRQEEILSLPAEGRGVDGELDLQSRSRRVRTVLDMAELERCILIASLQALLQPVPSRRSLRQNQIRLQVGGEASQEGLLEKALAAGLRQVPVVLGPGEVSRRGDVLDVFPLASTDAYRLLFFDQEVESIRSFDPASQNSVGVLTELTLSLGIPEEKSEVLDHVLGKDLLLLWYEPLRLEERQVQLLSPGDHSSRAYERFRQATEALAGFDLSALPSQDQNYKILSVGSAIGSGETDPKGRLRSIRGSRGSVEIYCRSQEEAERIREILRHKEVSPAQERITLRLGFLSRGFRIPELELSVISHAEFAGVQPRARVRERRALPSRALASFFELGPGDVVVHAVHGIAKFKGIELLQRGNVAEDHLRLMFRDEVSLLVPVSKIHLVQKYVGAGQARPRLDKLGGRSFARRKEEVKQALYDMAADLLDLQAARATIEREPYAHDALEEEFLDSFPYQDTPDQAEAWQEIRRDLEGRQPMDRLLCGDVGFGKTELAMRAAFKVAITGRQVAILVPTTVLAEQHGRTFLERFSPHGLVVDVLSRFRSAADRRGVLEDTERGRIDVLIGTHRLLSDDVCFRNLGLLVVDEEQRFGVRHKEHIKRLRRQVDILTLSATPIPRTMHSSLSGIRDISTLTQPPPGRQEVETRLAFSEPRLLAQAVSRELLRGGQVFVLHNRIASIERAAEEVRRLAPAAKVTVGHGKMTELQMEKALRRFIRGEADVLVCTTIIENGLDLPRVNTILIERADRYGLAELHQLRGRVGRSSVRAHCYLLLDRSQPLGEDARRRLKAIEEFSSLGAGFAIAMKDLEIRGAGNLLGPEQSGHIAAVGYEMYCQLLRQAMESAREQPAVSTTERISAETREVDVDLRVPAFIPDGYLVEPKARLSLLREMDGAVDPEATAEIGRSVADRFGPMPEPVQNLLLLFLLKNLLGHQAVLGIQFPAADRLVLRHRPEQPLGGAWLDSFADVRQVDPGKTHLILPAVAPSQEGWTGVEVLDFLLQALLEPGYLPRISKTWQQATGRATRTRSG